MMLILGALVLLAGVTLGVNNMLLSKTTTMLETEAALNSIALGQSMIDEIMTQAFDAKTADGTRVYNVSDFTAPGGLGPNGTESSNVPLPEPPDTAHPYKSFKYYNDIDDYNGYTRLAFTTMGTFTITDTVYYVQLTSPDVKTMTQTFAKKVIVTVRHPNMKYPLQLSDVAVYRKYF